MGVSRGRVCSIGVASAAGGGDLWGEGADLDEVVGEDAVSAPGSGSGDAGEFGAVPAVASFEVVDSSFGSGSPFDLVAEGSPVFEFAARGAGLGCAWGLPHLPRRGRAGHGQPMHSRSRDQRSPRVVGVRCGG